MELNRKCQIALNSNHRDEDLWLKVLTQIHLHSDKHLYQEIESADPAFLIVLWALPEHQIHQLALKRLRKFDYQTLVAQMDRLIEMGNNRFGVFLFSLASSLLAQDSEDRKILLILAQTYLDGHQAPLVSASAKTIYRNVYHSLP